jgi:hypothetical protein
MTTMLSYKNALFLFLATLIATCLLADALVNAGYQTHHPRDPDPFWNGNPPRR